ncbi:MAG: sigma-70 family RNA polymerase sigma factor [Planctomycetes bacterium]|nr:sigma-70 family RNA polymerase sigma factor [Planctomycetota bacterium]
MDLPDDARLIGDLLDQHGAALELYASQWTNCPEDCVQEAFVELAGRLQPPGHVVAWLYRVVRNRAMNAGRAARRRVHHEQIAGAQRRQAIGDVEKFLLTEALNALTAEDREVVVLRVWSDLSWQQIAELINTSSSSAQRRYAGALEKLKQVLEPTCLPNIIYRPS